MKKNLYSIRRNSLTLNFAERGENFTLNVPHYNKWLAIIAFLRKRGWKIGENEYFKTKFSCLSKYNKIGFKNDLNCLMELGANFISVEFGNKQNL